MILIDTSAFVEFLNRTGSRFDLLVTGLLEDGADVAFADVAVTEILQGIKADQQYHEVKEALLSFPILSLRDAGSYVAAADIYRRCRKTGLTVRSTVDLLIAQIALENDIPVLHNDRDFHAISDVTPLKVVR